MAQTGYTPILLYSSSTTTNAPAAGNLTNSTFGSELAINITDGKLFYKDNTNAVQVIAWKTTPTTAGGTGLTSYTAGDLPYYATGTTLSKLAIGTNGQILTSTGTAPQWTTLSSVAVTSISFGTTGLTPATATQGAVTVAGTLITTNGGTGLSSYTAGDLTYFASGTALTKLAIGASGRWLGSSGTAPQWNAPAALTKTDDTNVTLTLGGSATTALLNAASITVGWTGTLAVSRGGTGTGTAFTAGSVLFAGASGTYSQDNANFFWDDANNRLGLGTASPSRQLHIAGASTSNGIFLVNTAQTSGVDIELGSSDFRFQVRNNIPTVFLNNNVETFRIAAGGDVTAVGNFVVGTSGKGIDFSATAGTGTSELLADYEEGLWSPILSDGTNNATMSVSTEGRYTKIGNTLFYRARVRLTSLGSVTGAVRVTGLPFTVTNLNSNYGGGSTIALGLSLNVTAGYAVSQIPENTTTYVSLWLWDAVGGQTALQASEMTNTSDIYFSGQYQV